MATQKDVARLAGVSVSTVSHVINGRSDIPDRTATIVQEAMEKLDYKPNRLARALMKNRSERIGLVVDGPKWFLTQVHGTVLSGIAEALSQTEYCIDLFVKSDVDQSLTAEWRARCLDGIIVLPMPLSQRTISALERTEIPVVVIDSYWPSESIRFVTSDNAVGGQLVAEHLIGLGHTRLAYIGAANEYVSMQRLHGFKNGVKDAGMGLRVDWIVEDDWTYETTYHHASRWFMASKEERPTGIFAASDRLALAVCAAATDQQWSVGQDVAVVGYDDTSVSLEVRPTLSSVRQDGYLIGDTAVEMLFQMINEQDATNTQLPVELMVRESSGPFRKET